MKKINKTSAWIRLITSSIIAIFLIVILIYGISGKGFSFGFPFISFGSSHYPNESSYTVGNTSIDADELKRIEVNWLNGSVEIEAYDGETIEVSESSSQSLDEGDRVRSLYRNGKLTIQFRQSQFALFSSVPSSKALHIRIPNSLAKDVRNLLLDSVSSDNHISNLSIGKCEIDTVSGSITMEGNVRDFELDTVSGDCQLTTYTTPEQVDTDSVSGDVTLNIPEDANFTAEHDSVSGKLSSDFSTSLSGDDEFVCGDGGVDKWKFDSVSGDVRIQIVKR